ncbi:MAG: Metal dependent phosphohydrolase, region [Betaproteobacteria bacterium]|nr:Metal dependent phosphohydrolase, region [Betaproteobacteria bacterium]
MNGDTLPHPDLGQSIEIMRRAHEGQLDKSGRPYYLHPLRVAMRLIHCTPEERHAALLHDVVEDTPLTLADLRALGYSDEVLDLVDILTRRMPAGESHREYLERIVASGNAKALRVKLADVLDNSSPARSRALPPEHQGMKHRFAKDLQRIAEALREMGDVMSGLIVRGDL